MLEQLQAKIDTLERARLEEERRRLRHEDRARQAEDELARPRQVADLAPFPAVRHALGLVAGSSASAFNWLSLAQAMSEAGLLLPPACVRVGYTPQPSDDAMEVVEVVVAEETPGEDSTTSTPTDASPMRRRHG